MKDLETNFDEICDGFRSSIYRTYICLIQGHVNELFKQRFPNAKEGVDVEDSEGLGHNFYYVYEEFLNLFARKRGINCFDWLDSEAKDTAEAYLDEAQKDIEEANDE